MPYISITTPTYDPQGNVLFSYDRVGSSTKEMTRRVTRTAALDGTVDITDSGFSHGDRTLTISAELSKSKADRLEYVFCTYSEVYVSFEDGVFSACLTSFNNVYGRVSLTIYLNEKLGPEDIATYYCPYDEQFLELDLWKITTQHGAAEGNAIVSLGSGSTGLRTLITNGFDAASTLLYQPVVGNYETDLLLRIDDFSYTAGFDSGKFRFRLSSDDSQNYAEIFVYYDNASAAYKVTSSMYEVGVQQSAVTTTTATIEYLRITRSGSTFSVYFRSTTGDYTLLDSWTYTGGRAGTLGWVYLLTEDAALKGLSVDVDYIVFLTGCPAYHLVDLSDMDYSSWLSARGSVEVRAWTTSTTSTISTTSSTASTTHSTTSSSSQSTTTSTSFSTSSSSTLSTTTSSTASTSTHSTTSTMSTSTHSTSTHSSTSSTSTLSTTSSSSSTASTTSTSSSTASSTSSTSTLSTTSSTASSTSSTSTLSTSSSSSSTASTASTLSTSSSTSSTASTSSSTSTLSTTSTSSSSSSSTTTYWCDQNDIFTSLDLWQIGASNGTVTSVGGKMHCDVVDSTDSYAYGIYQYQLPDSAFSFSIDIDNYTPDATTDGLVAAMRVADNGFSWGGTIDGCRIWTTQTAVGTFPIHWEFKINNVSGGDNTINLAAMPSAYRCRRVGTTLYLDYYNGSWNNLGSSDFAARAGNVTNIILLCYDDSLRGGSVDFDNLIFYSGCPAIYPKAWTTTTSTTTISTTTTTEPPPA